MQRKAPETEFWQLRYFQGLPFYEVRPVTEINRSFLVTVTTTGSAERG